MAGAGGTPPLRLKDLLELDCDSCSAAGFRCYPRRLGESAPAMRRLLDSPSPSLRWRHTTTSKLLSSSLSRTLSRRLGFFWRRHDDGEDDAAPTGRCSGSESRASSSPTPTTSYDSSRRTGSRCESDSDFSTATTDSMDAATVMATADGDGHEAMKRGSTSSGSEADDKEEQLSPVAVMDFPFDDDEEGEDAGACSPSPSFSLERLHRRKMHKIRRFRSTEELGPVDLETLLAATSDDANDLADDVPEQRATQRSTEDEARPSSSHRDADVGHEPNEHGVLALLMDAGMDGHVTKRLLLDFFAEMKRRRGGGSMQHHWGEPSAPAGLLLPREEAERLLGDGDVVAAARGWLDGAGSERWGLNDVLRGGRALVAEMDRSRRWMQIGEEEREVGVVVAGMLVDQLVDEVVAWCVGFASVVQ
nr:unnamed protein product [Digitaria exilis]